MATRDPVKAQFAYEKKRTALKNYCLGRDYFDVLRAITFAEDYHSGFRKDGITPEFQHQIEIALYATTLKGLTNEDESILLQIIMLHDVMEDYPVSFVELKLAFGEVVAEGVRVLSKVINGKKKSMDDYMEGFLGNFLAAIAKGCDRVHNVQSMRGVFNYGKQQEYTYEVRDRFFPMLRRVRDLAPQYRQAINNIKHMLESQIQWVEYLHESIALEQQILLRDGVSNTLPVVHQRGKEAEFMNDPPPSFPELSNPAEAAKRTGPNPKLPK